LLALLFCSFASSAALLVFAVSTFVPRDRDGVGVAG
jgi:hypothetical protein